SCVDPVLSVLLAPACAACDVPLDHPTAGPVCQACWQSIRPLTPPLCTWCGDPLPTWRVTSIELMTCARCRRTVRHIDPARPVGEYDGALRALVQALKFDGRRSLAKPLAAMMKTRGAEVLAGASAVVPVPLPPSRRRERGFDQALDLANRLDLPV